jgi:hypothetical protein
LIGEHGNAVGGDGGGGVVLGREDVARGPAHFGAERGQRFDQHRGLDRHVQRSGDARALQRLRLGEFLADRHQARHLGFGDADFLAAPGGKPEVGDGVVFLFSHGVHDGSLNCDREGGELTLARYGLGERSLKMVRAWGVCGTTLAALLGSRALYLFPGIALRTAANPSIIAFL